MSDQHYIERYWRDATPADAIREPPMMARFRNDDGRWIEKNFRLLGWSRLGTRNNDCLWYSDGVGCYKECQVYDAPDPGEGWRLIDVDKDKPQFSDEYYLQGSKTWTPREHVRAFSTEQFYRRRIEPPKPDPGEGWRLIDPDKDKPQYGDQYYFPGSKMWLVRDHEMAFSTKQCYRRRIEQPKPKYEPFRWEDREQLRGRWYELTLSCGEVRECQIEFLRLDRNVFFIGSFPSDELLQKNARFLDTGEPVGRKIQ